MFSLARHAVLPPGAQITDAVRDMAKAYTAELRQANWLADVVGGTPATATAGSKTPAANSAASSVIGTTTALLGHFKHFVSSTAGIVDPLCGAHLVNGSTCKCKKRSCPHHQKK